MTYISQQALTKEDFLSQYRDHPRYELVDGELIDMEPTGPHETVSGKVATQIGIHLLAQQLPWFIPRTCLIYPFADAATARRPDIVDSRRAPFQLITDIAVLGRMQYNRGRGFRAPTGLLI